MRRFVEGIDRGQATQFPECLEDFIDEDNPVRVVDAFVDSLNLSRLGFEGVAPEATGRPSYHPSVLLKLYVYGYLNRVQSSRRLEREALRNVEVMWLTGRLTPDHKTIADFRKDDGKAIKQGLRTICRTVPPDGSVDDGKCCDRREQVQGGQHPRQELHAGQGGTAARPIGEERSALPCTARHCRPAGAIGRAGGEDGAFEGEVGQAGQRDAAAGGDGEANAGVTRSADIADRSRQPLDGDQRPWLRCGRLRRSQSIRNIT